MVKRRRSAVAAADLPSIRDDRAHASIRRNAAPAVADWLRA